VKGSYTIKLDPTCMVYTADLGRTDIVPCSLAIWYEGNSYAFNEAGVPTEYGLVAPGTCVQHLTGQFQAILKSLPSEGAEMVVTFEWEPHRLFGAKVQVALPVPGASGPLGSVTHEWVPIEELQDALATSLWQKEKE
jgi:hypothetical protein